MRLATQANRRVIQSELPSQLAQVMARAPGIERVLVKPGAVLRQIDAGARYDDRVARRILEPEGIVCPPLETYLQPWVDVVRRHAVSGP